MGVGKEWVQKAREAAKVKHKITILSLHDAQASCSCGWNLVRTGAATKAEIQRIHDVTEGGK